MPHSERSRADRKQEFVLWAREEAEAFALGIIDYWEGALLDKHDPYGSVMGAFFQVAEILTWQGVPTPREWQYRAGAGGTRSPEVMAEEGEDIAQLFVEGAVSLDDLRTLGDFLHEADEKVRELGLDY